MERTHGSTLYQTREVDIRGGVIETYLVYFPCILNSVAYPVEGCPERSHTLERLREKFLYRNWKARVAILQERPPPFPR